MCTHQALQAHLWHNSLGTSVLGYSFETWPALLLILNDHVTLVHAVPVSYRCVASARIKHHNHTTGILSMLKSTVDLMRSNQWSLVLFKHDPSDLTKTLQRWAMFSHTAAGFSPSVKQALLHYAFCLIYFSSSSFAYILSDGEITQKYLRV